MVATVSATARRAEQPDQRKPRDAAVKFAEASPLPEPGELTTQVYAP
jgi:hypothetical protein